MIDRFMRRNSGCIAALCFLVILGMLLYREATKVETPPFWFSGNQIDWEIKHEKTPIGADAVSQFFIDVDGYTYVPWKKEKGLKCYGFNSQVRWQWEGDKLLIRTVDGKNGIFSGGGQLHHPLTADPWGKEGEDKRPLRECLDPRDDGTILSDFKRGRTITEAIEASGGIVVRPTPPPTK